MVNTPKRKQKGNQRVIHQIFFDIGKGQLKDKPEWIENMNVNKNLNRGWRHILWTDKSAQTYINKYFPQYKGMISSFPNKFYLIDFFRYLVLSKMGGVYIDMDVRCKRPLPDVPTMLGYSNINNNVNNNVIRLPNEYTGALLDYSISEYKRIKEKDLFSTMPGRRFLHSVSATMFARFCRINNIKSDINFKKYFKDEEARSWIGGENAVVKKGF